jgi:hypothetical protein
MIICSEVSLFFSSAEFEDVLPWLFSEKCALLPSFYLSRAGCTISKPSLPGMATAGGRRRFLDFRDD